MKSGFVHRLSCGLLDFPIPILGKRTFEPNPDKKKVINRADLIELILEERRKEKTGRKRRSNGRRRHSTEIVSHSSNSMNDDLVQKECLSNQRTRDSLSPNTEVMFDDSNLNHPGVGYEQVR
ncbi:BA75_01451T0 [Komagataella pastoris]|uniref:BA75_01451T0 n=1 Tax=Komagataella pastoris TaxID=4922 RepID=A0A1B2J6S4_PICPA|nr:BA75_01451T0 [Komagataella pastoris]